MQELRLVDVPKCIGIGDNLTFKYDYFPEEAGHADFGNINRIQWSSTNPNVATVDPKSGRINGIARGECDIIADVEGVSVQHHLSVKPYVNQITVTPSNLILKFGDTAKISITTSPKDCINEKNICCTFSQSDIVEYDHVKGILLPKSSGTTKVEFYTKERPSVRNSCMVTVENVFAESNRGSLFIILSAIAFLIGLFTCASGVNIFFGIISIILSIISMNVDKSGWTGLNVILIIANIFVIISTCVMLHVI